MDPKYEIISTQKQNIYITTTGISNIEIEIINSILPKNFILENTLSTSTTYLVTYKALFTEKYIQALKWEIPVIDVEWLYDTSQNIKKYYLLPFVGTCFTTSNVTNDIFKNYYKAYSAFYSPNLNISTDFLISSVDCEGEKNEFAKKYKIPIIDPENVFKNDFSLFGKSNNYTVLDIKTENIFENKIFYLESTLPSIIFNKLKRLIIENEGTRVSSIDNEVDYIITTKYSNIKKYENKNIYYQYIFDCVEQNILLLPDFYCIYNFEKYKILDETVCVVDKGLQNNRIILYNKIKAMGGRIKSRIDSSCTHFIVKNKKEFKKDSFRPYKVISFDWIDQCLYSLRFIKEDRYLVSRPTLNVFKLLKERENIKNVIYIETKKNKIFQFTGLAFYLKEKAIKMLNDFNIDYIDGDRYEKCTHLIMGSVSTSEKFLSCLAQGGWILKPNFIDDYDNSESFNFEKYEWSLDENFDENDKKIIASVKKWREKVLYEGKPAFYKWKVKLYCDDPKKESYIRVLQNGGATMTEADDYTHCFVDKKYTGKIKEHKYFSTDYIFSYLFKGR
ncbi:putative BRCT domain-containing cell cycle checkpoint protein [Hamiltosporidium tvaerminnensis]|uniref:Putative BRCT domain-containing cell cycle checkpoint protein n=1 Tax=Hamiltosporidium tvaerminnensis TaxID=1176355 RepID=A0A4Q9LTX2_9MICR|nr:putative BRCT domain-containing cell cycle checkpoint protein [Hamiltosporidium tvaerminnensis]